MRARWARRFVALATALTAAAIGAGCTETSSPARDQNVATIPVYTTGLPNYIFPFNQLQLAANINRFQVLMWRPLYWTGDGDDPTVDFEKSLADPPIWSNDNRTVTIPLKSSYEFSDGTTLGPANVAFWMGLAITQKNKYFGYTPGYFPDNVASVSYDEDANTVTLELTQSYSPDWFLNDQLTQIIPLPTAWDLVAGDQPGQCSSGDLAAQEQSCPAVYEYLDGQAKDLSTYATNPLWQVVSGPWKLSSFSPDGHITMVPNESYSGPVKASLSELRMVPYTSASAILTALRAGSDLTIGEVPTTYAPPADGDGQPSSQTLAPNYELMVEEIPRIAYVSLNYRNPELAPLFDQLYIRQALTSVVNQELIIDKALNGYGVPVVGPIPLRPDTEFISPAQQDPPYPFSIENARDYLTSHGWSIPDNGPAVCTSPGTGPENCGAGIAAGHELVIPVTFATGRDPSAEVIMEQWRSDAAQAGIVLDVAGETYQTWLGKSTACIDDVAECTSWGAFFLGGQAPPQAYPTGEQSYASSAASNVGGWDDPATDQLIQTSTTSPELASLHAYADHLTEQVPYIWIPATVGIINAVDSDLRGASPMNLHGRLEPENWYFEE
ncbi:ABC transporter substrate-binding protein [Jiangella asiatica]|uniref:Solute-binding protein family 5 domain-containing protein n=1 Tax=Jiangella asiatica TaxID=2530372 RepID=A0A4R5DAI3_9ACTN|nr:ABC transporter substrate-binding protein [Jiangella asiatica]TDE08454.1 hypothetical protein E1269_17240 [Jiangella asiatica]